MNSKGETVASHEDKFNEFACLTYDNVEELEFNIEKMRKQYKSMFRFWKLSMTEMIDRRKEEGVDASDLEAALIISNQKYKITDTIKVSR